jgi:flagellar FliL protein
MAVDVETEGAVVAKTGGRKRLLIIGAAALIAVLVIGGVLYFVMGVGRSSPAAAAAAASTAAAAVPAAPASFIFNLPEMTVNLNTNGQGQSFMKLTVALEVADQATMTLIQPRMAKVVDAFQVYLRELRPSDLDGSAGVYRLKEELLRRVNVAVAPEQVDNVLFKEILVQ